MMKQVLVRLTLSGILLCALGLASTQNHAEAQPAATSIFLPFVSSGPRPLIQLSPTVGRSTGGTPYQDTAPENGQITEIWLSASGWIEGIQFWFMRTDRTLYTTGMHGGWGGTLYRIVFAADEYIVALNGKAGLYLDALSIVTNKRTLSYGSGGDTPFSFTATAGHEIVGLYGRAAGLFDNTGAIERVRASVPFTTEPPTGAERPLVKLSPIVGYNHEPAIPYEDTVPDDARVIAFGVRRGEALPPGETLRQLQFWYQRSDGSIYTVGPRGFSSVGSMFIVNLEADEYITAFVGKAGEFLDSLAVVTNKRTYGPWGGPGGDPYTIAAPAGYEIVGMFGRHSLGLDNTGFFARQKR